MRSLVYWLIGLAGVAFLSSAALDASLSFPVWGNNPEVYWRLSIGFLAFAAVLSLVQIRDQALSGKD